MERLELKVENLSLDYFGGYCGVSDASFEMRGGDKLCIFGGHNQGKTSLLRALAGLEEYEGHVFLCGKELRDIAPQSRDICYSFGTDSLIPRKSVLSQITLPLRLRGADDAYIASRLGFVKDLFGIEDLLNVKVKELNEKQKCIVLLARVFIRESKLYLLDNVLGRLDYNDRKAVFSLLYKAVADSDAMVIYATDRLTEACALGDRIAVMANGCVEQTDEFYKLYSDPYSLSVVRAVDENLGVVSGCLKEENGAWSLKIYDDMSVGCAQPVAANFRNKIVCCCVYPHDVEILPDKDGMWKIDAEISTKEGKIVEAVRDDNFVYAKAQGLKRGDTANVVIKRAGNCFDCVSERKINR